MNYIAHLHIAAYTQTSLLGNFLGDFVKGSDLTHLPTKLEEGIRLHRSVDTFTDSHKLICELKRQFPKDLRRMAGVVIDIYFDHLLLKHWHDFSDLSYHNVFKQFYTELKTFTLPKQPHYTQQAKRLISHQWLKEYHHEPTCFRAFGSIENRLKGKIQFANKAELFVKQHRKTFTQCFQQFYPELLEHGLHLINSNAISGK
jgi:acyl carrier protein phosphodiesterase